MRGEVWVSGRAGKFVDERAADQEGEKERERRERDEQQKEGATETKKEEEEKGMGCGGGRAHSTMGRSCRIRFIASLRLKIVGYSSLIGVLYTRFRSTPLSEVR